MTVCILRTMISSSDIPATKIKGLNTMAIRLDKLKSLPNDFSQVFSLNRSTSTINGAPMIKIRRSPILMILAIKRRKSAIVKKKIITNLRAKLTVRVGIFSLLWIPMISLNLNIPIPR